MRFAGTVSIGQTFDQEIAPGLVFRLDPSSTGEPIGWTMRVVPTPANKFADYLAVVTPPYHFRNPRYLDTAYDVSAEEAVAWSPREFFFVLNETDYLRAWAALEQFPGATDQQLERAERVLVEIAKGRGWLCITDSTLSQPTGHGPRSILSLSFEVVMQLPRP